MSCNTGVAHGSLGLILWQFKFIILNVPLLVIRDGPNPEAKDSNPNPNHFILLEFESEFTQVCNGFES